MDFELTHEKKLIKETARKFADQEIIPVARENDALERFPWDLIKKMAPLGFLGATVPEEYGGAGLDYISDAIIFEEVGRGCSSLRTIISVQVSLAEHTILKWGTEEQRKKYLPKLCSGEYLGCFGLTEPGAGSDPASMKTTATRKGDGWVLNGSKTWISTGGLANVGVIFAQADPSKGY